MSKEQDKTTAATPTKPEPEDDKGLERLVFFSDAVFAIAMTLLALDIRLPGPPPDTSDASMLNSLLETGPKYLAYFISFAAIGLFWIGHNRTFKYIKWYDNSLIFLNLLLLMFIGFMPFTSSLLSDYSSSRIVLVVYALELTATSIVSILIWLYAGRNDLLMRIGPDGHQARRNLGEILSTPISFAIAAFVAWWSYALAWVLLWGILIVSVIHAIRIRDLSRPPDRQPGQSKPPQQQRNKLDKPGP